MKVICVLLPSTASRGVKVTLSRPGCMQMNVYSKIIAMLIKFTIHGAFLDLKEVAVRTFVPNLLSNRDQITPAGALRRIGFLEIPDTEMLGRRMKAQSHGRAILFRNGDRTSPC